LMNLTPWKPTEDTDMRKSGGENDLWDMDDDSDEVDAMSSYIV
jgi:hypothetical protein